MPRKDFYPIFERTIGLDNKVEDFRIPYSEDEGIVALSRTQNVIIDDVGGIEVRPGKVLVSEGAWHSIFCDGGDMVGVKDGDLCLRLDTQDVVLAPGFDQRVSCCMVNGEIYYTSGDKNGRVVAGTHQPWPAMEYGRDTDIQFSGPIPARHIAFHLSRIWLANGNLVVFSEPLGFSLFDLGNSAMLFDAPVVMIRPVEGGVYISTTKKVYFLAGRKIGETVLKVVSEVPAVEWSACQRLIPGKDLGFETEEFYAAWVSESGLFIGNSQGQVVNITKDHVDFYIDEEDFVNEGALCNVAGKFFFHIGR
jgi:hypothetical protein